MIDPFRNAKKNNKKGKGGGQPAAPGGFTEPNFGKVKQKSTMAKGGTTHGSFTHKWWVIINDSLMMTQTDFE